MVLAFGAGALISAIGFELAAEGLEVGGLQATAAGLGAGALVYFGLDGWIAIRFATGRGRAGRAGRTDAGTALALGAFLDGIPEQLGARHRPGRGRGRQRRAPRNFVANLPEAIGSAVEMGPAAREQLLAWVAVATICILATRRRLRRSPTTVSGDVPAPAIDGFAAGALLVMLIDSMIPEEAQRGSAPASSPP